MGFCTASRFSYSRVAQTAVSSRNVQRVESPEFWTAERSDRNRRFRLVEGDAGAIPERWRYRRQCWWWSFQPAVPNWWPAFHSTRAQIGILGTFPDRLL